METLRSWERQAWSLYHARQQEQLFDCICSGTLDELEAEQLDQVENNRQESYLASLGMHLEN